MSILEKLFASTAFHNKLTPESLSKNTIEIQDKVGFGENPTFSADAFNTLDDAKLVDYQGFSKTKGPGDVSILEKLNPNTPQANFVKDAIKAALKREDSYLKAKNDFNDAGNAFSELVKKVPAEFSAQALIGALKEIKTEAFDKVTEQYNLDKKRITEQFDVTLHPEFSNNLMQVLGIPGTATDESSNRALTLVKTNLLNDLEASHKKQQEEFTKQTDESLDKLTQNTQEKLNEMSLLYALAKEDKSNLEHFIKKSREKSPTPIPAGIAPEVSISENFAQFKNISLKDVEKLRNFTGSDIVQAPPGVFTVQMSGFNPFYYGDPRQKPLADMMLIARLIKDSKFTKITMTITGFSADDQLIRAQQAFEACIRNGFKLENITIKIGGQEKKPEELFSKAQGTYSQLLKLSDTLTEKKAEPNAAVNTASIKTAKQAISDLKEVKRAAEEEKPQETPTPRPPGT